MSIASVGRVSDVALDGRHQRAERSRTAVVDALLSLYDDGILRPGVADIAAWPGPRRCCPCPRRWWPARSVRGAGCWAARWRRCSNASCVLGGARHGASWRPPWRRPPASRTSTTSAATRGSAPSAAPPSCAGRCWRCWRWTMAEPAGVTAWEARGRLLSLPQGEVWVLDQPPADDAGLDPVLLLHGFPTCSFDWRHVLPALSRRRRVVAFDFPGFGLSAKPDRRYSLRHQADVAESVCAALGLGRIALVTHDMGDTVGGELLARDLDGDLDFEISRRVLANGSIYLELAQLTPGQLFLLDLPDARLEPPAQRSAGERPAGERDEGAAMRTALAATFAPDHQPGPDELAAQWALIARNDGHHLLPRTVRFLDGE